MPAWFARLVRVVSEALGKSVCEVVSEYGLCEAIDELQGGDRVSVRSLNDDKWVEKFVSRVGVYKPGYLIVRVRDSALSDAWRYVVLALREEYKLNELDRLLTGGSGGLHIPDLRGFANHEFVVNLARELGFNDVFELSRYLKAVVDGLIRIDAVTKDDKKRRKVSMDEVRSVICRICGVEIPALGRPSESIRNMIKHFKEVHGLGTTADVEAKARELDKAQFRDFLPTDPRLLRLELSMSASVIVSLAARLNLIGFTAEGSYVYVLCRREFASEFELAEHLIHNHYAELTEQPQQTQHNA